jgi:hypothetical protein
MTWSELKTAVEDARIGEDDEICLIECAREQGDKTLHVTRLGQALKLTESHSSEASDYIGCAT